MPPVPPKSEVVLGCDTGKPDEKIMGLVVLVLPLPPLLKEGLVVPAGLLQPGSGLGGNMLP